MSKVVTLIFWKRPQYAQRVLEHLSRCKGIENYELIIQIDGPPNSKIHHLCAAINFAQKDIQFSHANMGCNVTTKKVLHRGFERSDYVIHVEEDVILAPDALQFFEWAKQFGSEKDLLNIAALRHPNGWLREHGAFPNGQQIECKVQREGGFSCWGWATWKDRWIEMEKRWTTGTDRALSWDIVIDSLRREWNKCQLMPHVSRVLNIGAEGGVHRGDYLLSYWAGSPGFVMPSTYFLVT